MSSRWIKSVPALSSLLQGKARMYLWSPAMLGETKLCKSLSLAFCSNQRSVSSSTLLTLSPRAPASRFTICHSGFHLIYFQKSPDTIVSAKWGGEEKASYVLHYSQKLDRFYFRPWVTWAHKENSDLNPSGLVLRGEASCAYFEGVFNFRLGQMWHFDSEKSSF